MWKKLKFKFELLKKMYEVFTCRRKIPFKIPYKMITDQILRDFLYKISFGRLINFTREFLNTFEEELFRKGFPI